ncbi:MAG: 50S ribosomal protein L19e [Cenarchaeum sp. SB0665_bin_23]|nr:50S ribosomal protein L19e [Cenarchaeum sp. SB0667_bin_13]MXY60634.1 50S ribosomal protein L19e [Cenarchaeum sp. SB0665_bin_23]MXZ93853.1 50S ribosomal protein L19e [Cenarchaeum sp. SB0666_bin_15]MYB47391.1 50S ribosomal protein L19e [Cenarchaeum sp. SB0662_bin_33]MYC80174.1 50S ribosomal protein L19e [Cenarchaeum sp. SB0661_bin_35]MYD58881.1 50S ribosomal protein L19e [Cenarchaeum sp. SB0678_bin_8]MYG33165.1 50S ribosomal protein L19e [Cenarchaeum sp. SB0677_bin_16]MYI52275.1 50S ribosom
MPINLRSKKKLLSRVTGVGIHRLRLDPDRLDDVADAITRNNARGLVTAGIVTIKPKKGTSRGRAQHKRMQRSKRGTKPGSKQGRKGARTARKATYVAKVRSLRRHLKIAKDRQEITNPEFWSLYKKVGGNTVRNKAHLRLLVQEIISKRRD